MVQPVGLNLEALQNVSAPEFNFSTNPSTFLNDMVYNANAVTGGFFGLIVLTGFFVYLSWYLGDVSQFGEFRYTFVRAGGIAAAISGILGLVSLNIGIFTNFYHVTIFIVVAMISTIWVWIEER